MSDTLQDDPQNSGEQHDRKGGASIRFYLGPVAQQLVRAEAGKEEPNREHLEEVIRKLKTGGAAEPSSIETSLSKLTEQMSQLHTDNIHIRFMLLALAGRNGDDVVMAIEKGNQRAYPTIEERAKTDPEFGLKAKDRYDQLETKRNEMMQQDAVAQQPKGTQERER